MKKKIKNSEKELPASDLEKSNQPTINLMRREAIKRIAYLAVGGLTGAVFIDSCTKPADPYSSYTSYSSYHSYASYTSYNSYGNYSSYRSYGNYSSYSSYSNYYHAYNNYSNYYGNFYSASW
jgi:hypothetical protein